MRNKGFSRFETNKKIKIILCRHRIDIYSLCFHSYPSYVEFSGLLLKLDGSSLYPSEVKVLLNELYAISSITHFNFSNWQISSTSIKEISYIEEETQNVHS